VDVIGHETIRRELEQLAHGAAPPHALLLAGPEHTGRLTLARYYASLLNCERLHPPAAAMGGMFAPEPLAAADGPPCGSCRTCRLIAEGQHPDIVVLSPGDLLCKPRPNEASHEKHPLSRDIRICQVRGTLEVVARFPFEARYRVIVIDPAERMRPEAANMLLKTLEEPPEHSLFVLVTAAPEAMLETVISRCRRIDIGTVARATIEEGLVARGIEPAVAETAAAASHGRPGRAVTFAADPGLIGDRARHLERCARLAGAKLSERFRYSEELRERWNRDRSLVQVELDAWEEFWETRLREAAGDGAPPDRLRSLVEALRAVGRGRDDLLANVQARAALDLMLLSFPRLTLETPREEASVAHV
jgi:DNA polymerase-3 subunit delta'